MEAERDRPGAGLCRLDLDREAVLALRREYQGGRRHESRPGGEDSDQTRSGRADIEGHVLAAIQEDLPRDDRTVGDVHAVERLEHDVADGPHRISASTDEDVKGERLTA